jgi:hypothetical protein
MDNQSGFDGLSAGGTCARCQDVNLMAEVVQRKRQLSRESADPTLHRWVFSGDDTDSHSLSFQSHCTR